jgi:hypothetical protein
MTGPLPAELGCAPGQGHLVSGARPADRLGADVPATADAR